MLVCDLSQILDMKGNNGLSITRMIISAPPPLSPWIDTPTWPLHYMLCTPSIKQEIKGIKGVPTTRMVAFKEGEENRISDKHLTWSLSRNGLYAGDVLVVRFARCYFFDVHLQEKRIGRVHPELEHSRPCDSYSSRARGNAEFFS